ncbi:MAG: thymidine kinase, partial [candidate division WWE3 bacterium]|nr:thymidine kinase [candidate division WWE3 bacterium]
MLGHLTVFAACMFAGKTDALITMLENLVKHGGLQVVAFYHVSDVRSGLGTLTAHTGKIFPAYPVGNAGEILKKLKELPDYDAIAIDEGQFFSVADDPDLFEVVRQFLSKGKRVIVAGLDLDFRGRPFGLVPALVVLAMALRGDVYHLKAVCSECGDPATMTQRFVDGQPARYDDPIILAGGVEEGYQAR